MKKKKKKYGSYLEGGYEPFVANPDSEYIKRGGNRSLRKPYMRVFGAGRPPEE